MSAPEDWEIEWDVAEKIAADTAADIGPDCCPTCGCSCSTARPRGRHGGAREERLDAVMVAALRLIAAHPGARIRPILHAHRIRGESHGKLRHWGLVSGGAGYYTATELGHEFLAGAARVSATVTVEDDHVVARSDATVACGDLV